MFDGTQHKDDNPNTEGELLYRMFRGWPAAARAADINELIPYLPPAFRVLAIACLDAGVRHEIGEQAEIMDGILRLLTSYAGSCFGSG